ncbi:putative UDP-arabinose 4-epimerase [Helianthus annuus]|nr:putative UDP-arabinose 4-epimerase [Helianthus annuus]
MQVLSQYYIKYPGILEAMATHNVYGEPEKMPITVETPQVPWAYMLNTESVVPCLIRLWFQSRWLVKKRNANGNHSFLNPNTKGNIGKSKQRHNKYHNITQNTTKRAQKLHGKHATKADLV